MSKEARKALFDVLRAVDWPRALNNASVFLRELRGDGAIDEDTARMRSAASRAKQTIEQAGRTASGCSFPCKGPRLCGFCQEAADAAAEKDRA